MSENLKAEKLLYDMDETCKLLGIKKSLLYQLTMRKEIAVCKIGKLNYFRRKDLEAFVNGNVVEGGQLSK
ncbi:MAG: helix-turn-helix domain-containing protein [Planctomycetes bacterium]|nr:helix-turn-helix domain-containing protein [Planctomycetota bacterium]